MLKNTSTSAATTDCSKANERLLRLPAVIERCGLEKSAIYAGMKSGAFPKCIKLGPRASAWPESEISHWIAERVRAARETK